MNRRGFIGVLIGAAVAPMLPKNEAPWRLWKDPESGASIFSIYSSAGNITALSQIYFTNGKDMFAQSFDLHRLYLEQGIKGMQELARTITDPEKIQELASGLVEKWKAEQAA